MSKSKPLHSVTYAAATPIILVLAGVVMLAMFPTLWTRAAGATAVHNTCGTTPLAIQIHAIAYVNRALFTTVEAALFGYVSALLLCSFVLWPARIAYWLKRWRTAYALAKTATTSPVQLGETAAERKKKLAACRRRVVGYLDRCRRARMKNRMCVAVPAESATAARWCRHLRMYAWLAERPVHFILAGFALGAVLGFVLCDISCVDVSHALVLKVTSVAYTGVILAIFAGVLVEVAKRTYWRRAASIAKYDSDVTTWAQLALWCRNGKSWGPLLWTGALMQNRNEVQLPKCAHIDIGKFHRYEVAASLHKGAVRLLLYSPGKSHLSFELLVEPWGATVRMRVETNYGYCTAVRLGAYESEKLVLASATGPQSIEAWQPILQWLVQQSLEGTLKIEYSEALETALS